jgi:hypothetical protein
MLPDEDIENYNCTFKHHSLELVTVRRLKRQVTGKGLDRFRVIQVLGGKAYVDRVRLAFGDFRASVEAPLNGLGIGESLQAVQRAVDSGSPLRARSSKLPQAACGPYGSGKLLGWAEAMGTSAKTVQRLE